jgi:RNA polymerase-interacting CarD/CdnL/TRCF family regulator
MKLGVGDVVVYASHGVGRVTARGGAPPDERVVIELPEGLVVTLPLSGALECLRPVANGEDVAAVSSVLQGADAPVDDVWHRRLKETQEKVRFGTAVGLAQVVREGATRQNASGRGETKGPSVRERQLYLKARQLLANELAVSLGLAPPAADDWIEQQLAAGARQPGPAAAQSA